VKGKLNFMAQKASFIVHEGLTAVNRVEGTSGGSVASTIGMAMLGMLWLLALCWIDLAHSKRVRCKIGLPGYSRMPQK
jgi:hypothetical protein